MKASVSAMKALGTFGHRYRLTATRYTEILQMRFIDTVIQHHPWLDKTVTLYKRFSSQLWYDWLMRIVFVSWASVIFLHQTRGFRSTLSLVKILGLDAYFLTVLLAQVTTLLFIFTAIVLALVRRRPHAKASGLKPRFLAIFGTGMIFTLLLFPRQEMTSFLSTISLSMILTGKILAVFSLLSLGKSFSVMAEARQLITRGPYTFIRHPLYLAEEISIIGIFLQYRTWLTGLIVMVHFTIQLGRIHYEEMILSQSIPEYHSYRSRTAKLLPHIF
jgi:protein-S-isoprenylcysteine O-methyltransferase Ste14